MTNIQYPIIVEQGGFLYKFLVNVPDLPEVLLGVDLECDIIKKTRQAILLHFHNSDESIAPPIPSTIDQTKEIIGDSSNLYVMLVDVCLSEINK